MSLVDDHIYTSWVEQIVSLPLMVLYKYFDIFAPKGITHYVVELLTNWNGR